MTSRRAASIVKRSRKGEGLDLFGDVPVTREDVYAWLLAVADMDPANFRAENYIRLYGVLDKIIAAKLDGRFDELVAPAKKSARLRELAAQGKAVIGAKNPYGVGEVGAGTSGRMLEPLPRGPRRTPEEIRRADQRGRLARRTRREARQSLLHRLPAELPALSMLLADLGDPTPEALAGALHVHPTSARRWIREDKAPYPVLLSLFWLTRWGVSAVDANAYNDAVMSATLAGLREREAIALREQIAQVERIADFGSANDPLPSVRSRRVTPEGAPADLPAIARSAPCGDAARSKKLA